MPVELLKDITAICPQDGKLLGMDVGKKTIGLAIGDLHFKLATPLETIQRRKFSQDMQALQAIIEAHEVAGFIIGYPINMDGSEGPRAQSVRDFALEMEKYLCSHMSFRRKPESRALKHPDPGLRGDDKQGKDGASFYKGPSNLSSPPSSMSSPRKRGSENQNPKDPRLHGEGNYEEPWIALWDERLSTVSVENTVDKLVDKRKTKINAKSSGLIDKLAAQVILQSALDFMDKSC